MSTSIALDRAGTRRWWVLATVIAAQFMFVVDAFIVNVAIPSIRADLNATGGEIEAVIAVYQLAYATLVITGGRLGDIYSRRRLFLLGLFGFTAASLWCGLAGSASELIVARLVQGAAAALMSPQVLAMVHTLFPDAARARAFAVFGIALGLGGATGLVLGGWLLAVDPGGTGWRSIFFVNGPVGIVIGGFAWRLLPATAGRSDLRLDIGGAVLLFLALLCLAGPLLAGRELGWPLWLLAVVAAGGAILVGFYRLQHRLTRSGGMPLVDLALLHDHGFQRGLLATAWFFAANMSFYLVVTLYLQTVLDLAPLPAGLTVLPLALAFVIASRQGTRTAAQAGLSGLVRGCGVQLLGLGGTAALVAGLSSPAPWLLALPLVVFGYGQGLVMAPLFGAVLAHVRQANAGAGSGILTTTQQIANGIGVAGVGLVWFSAQAAWSGRMAMLACLAALAVAVAATAHCLSRLTPASSRPGRAAGTPSRPGRSA